MILPFVVMSVWSKSFFVFLLFPINLYIYGNVFVGNFLPVRGKVIYNVAYKETPQGILTLDVYQPDSMPNAKPSPVVVFIHGGSWMRGNKEEISHGFQKECLKRLLKEGIAVVSIDYRLVDNKCSVIYPWPLADCKDAVRWTKCVASQYHFDTNRIAVMGTSAGAHLALMTAYAPDGICIGDPRYTQWNAKVRCVVDIYGPTHLGKILKANLPRPLMGIISPFFPKETIEMRQSLLWAFTGKSANQPNRRHQQCLLYSPCVYTKDAIPTIVFHGSKDKTVPLSQTLLLEKEMKKNGKHIEIHILEGEDHCFPSISQEGKKNLCDQLADFLNRCLL